MLASNWSLPRQLTPEELGWLVGVPKRAGQFTVAATPEQGPRPGDILRHFGTGNAEELEDWANVAKQRSSKIADEGPAGAGGSDEKDWGLDDY